MSGRKKLDRATRNNRVVAIPSRKAEREVLDKNGKVTTEEVQLYRIKPLR